MADTKISALTSGTTANSTDRVPIARSPFGAGDNRYVTMAMIDTFISATTQTLTNKTLTSPTLTTPALGAATATSVTASGLLQAGTTIGISTDLLVSRPAAATFQHGAADAASPVAQTISFQSVVAGTSNTAGANATFKASAGTGTGAGGSLIFQVAPAGSSGTSQNSFSTALTIASTLDLTTASGAKIFMSGATSGIGQNVGGLTSIQFGSATETIIRSTANYMADNSSYFGWRSAGTRLYSDASNQLDLRNSTSAQTFRAYNTYTDSSNGEWGTFDWSSSSNVLTIGTNKNGTGSTRNLQFIIGGTSRLDFGVTSGNRWTTDASAGIFAAVGPIAGSYFRDASNNFHMYGAGAGVITLYDSSETTFDRLQFGGTSTSFPALKRDGAGISARLANDSAGTWMKVLRTTVSGLPSASTSGAGAFAIVTDATAPTIGSTVTGGGAVQCFVISDGSNWLAA